MKSNKFDLRASFKYSIIIPALLVLTAIVIGAIFGFNLDYDFRATQSFNVKFNTTVTEVEYDLLEEKLNSMVGAEFEDFRLERIGEGAQNGIVVKIADSDAKLDSLKEKVEDELINGITLDSAVVIRCESTNLDTSTNYVNTICWAIGGVAFILLFTFIYVFIRYNLASAISMISSITLGVLTLLSILILARIPFNQFTILSVFLTVFLTVLGSMYINNHIKETLNMEKYNKFSNSDRVNVALSKSFKNLLYIHIGLMISILAIMFVGNLSLIYLSIACLVAIVVSFAMSIVFNTSIWALIYKKERDFILRRRIEKQNKPSENSEEKIVV